MISLKNLTQNIKLYSKLLKSVGRFGRGMSQKQPLSPVECAFLIKRLMDEEKLDKVKVSERLDLGRPKDETDIYKKRDTSQVNNFLSLLEVSEKSRDYAGWGWEGLPKISFTTISILSSSFTHDEQDKVLQAALQGDKKSNITKTDALKLRKWRSENPNLTVEDGIQKVLNLKPVTIITHVIVCYLSEKIKDFIKNNSDFKVKILSALRSRIPGKFYELENSDILMTLSMDEEAFSTFNNLQKTSEKSFTEFITDLLELEHVI